jgi:hypothetical protein
MRGALHDKHPSHDCSNGLCRPGKQNLQIIIPIIRARPGSDVTSAGLRGDRLNALGVDVVLAIVIGGSYEPSHLYDLPAGGITDEEMRSDASRPGPRKSVDALPSATGAWLLAIRAWRRAELRKEVLSPAPT